MRTAGRVLLTLACILLALWSALALFYAGGWAGRIAAGALVVGLLWLWRRGWKWAAGAVAIGFAAVCFWLATIEPSLDLDWTRDMTRMPYADIEGGVAQIRNIRNNEYRSPADFTPAWYDRTFRLDEIESAWFVVEPLSDWKAVAHTMVSFGFKGDRYLAISVEIRREQGEEYSPLAGLFKQYELMYVIGDERDLIRLRSNYRRDDVFLYPIKTTRERIRALFVDMLERANRLTKKPEFYNTIFSSCTTNIVDHVNRIVPNRVPFGRKIVFPGYSDELAFELGLIDTNDSLEVTRERCRINERALAHDTSADFSVRIREGIPRPSQR